VTRIADTARGECVCGFQIEADQTDPTPANAEVDLRTPIAAAVPTLPAYALLLLLAALLAAGLASIRRGSQPPAGG
jgi:hypothetical protein